MIRDYVGWYKLKADIEKAESDKLFHAREVWWCSLGANIGFEEDGKGLLFERPVLIVRKFSKELFLGVPLTTKSKENKFYHPIVVNKQEGAAMISQVRVLSAQRLNRKLVRIGKNNFNNIVDKISQMVALEKSISADFSAESPVPSGNLYLDNNKLKQKSQVKGGRK